MKQQLVTAALALATLVTPLQARVAYSTGPGPDVPIAAAAPVAPPAPTAAKWVLQHPLGRGDFRFPFRAGAPYDKDVTDTYGDGRSWSPDGTTRRSHEGIDIPAPKGTPLVAIGDGKIVRIGWSEYGGWRLLIALDDAPGFKAYYAHLNGYGENLYEGARVRKGQVIGYVGRTGYGPEGHEGDFPPHLHFGIYTSSSDTINPHPFLKLWQVRLGD